MERRFIVRGLLAGAIGGILAFVFARIFAEPQIQAAIDYESGRDAAQAALDKAAGLPAEAAGAGPVQPDDPGQRRHRRRHDPVRRGDGRPVRGRVRAGLRPHRQTCGPRTLALLVAGGGFLGFYLIPFIKYPANPPAIGHEETIRDRGGLYLLMVVRSIAFLVLAVWLGQRLKPRFGNWNATLLAGLACVVALGIVMSRCPRSGICTRTSSSSAGTRPRRRCR